MLELFNIFVRYLLVAVGAHLVATGYIDETLVEPLIGASMTALGLGWMLVTNGYIRKLVAWVKTFKWFK